MSENPGSKDKSFETLDFIINVLKEHEKNLDSSINELTTVAEQIGENQNDLKDKVEAFDEKVNDLQKQITNLLQYISNTPKNSLSTTIKDQTPQVQISPIATFQNELSGILHCKQLEDFQKLAANAQKLAFSYKEDEKVFQVDALKGNQIITYQNAFSNFSAIIKKMLTLQLDINERDIFEGFLNKTT